MHPTSLEPTSMKRLTFKRGKHVIPSAEAVATVAAAAARAGLTLREMIATSETERRHATISAGALQRSDALKSDSRAPRPAKRVGR